MSTPKTLILNIAEEPNKLSTGRSSGGGVTPADLEQYAKKSDLSIYATKEELDSYVKTVDIVDDLITLDPTKPLSASQGRELKRQLDVLKADVAKIIVDGIGIAAGDGIRVTVSDNTTYIHVEIDPDSPLAINENGQLFLHWSE